MGCCDKFAKCQQRYLKCFSFMLFTISIMLIVISLTMFRPLNDKIHAGKVETEYHVEQNIVAQKLCKFCGVLGITLSVLAYLTATKRKLYFAIPLALGAFLLGTMFAAVLAMTFSQQSARFFKSQTCDVLRTVGKIGTLPAFSISKTMNMNMIDKFMCTRMCPCDEKHAAAWHEHYSEEGLNFRNRTWKMELPMKHVQILFVAKDE